MATQKPISTISYNSLAFLREKLDNLYAEHIIQAYMFIRHKGEDGDKDHIHLRIEPNKRIDPMDLFDVFLEYVPDNPKPLCCRPFRQSKEEDWFLYVTHDKDYLRLKYGDFPKGEKIPYNWQDIEASPYYDTEIAFVRAKQSLEHSSPNLAYKLQSGVSPLDLVLQGESPMSINALCRVMNESSSLAQLQNRLDVVINKLESCLKVLTENGYEYYWDEMGNFFMNKY